MPTNKILDLYADLARQQEEGTRFIVNTFKNEEYGASRPQLTVIDLGAWQGDYSFYCLPFAKEIYAVEPDPVPYKVLEKTISKYELEQIIRPFRIAIGGSNGRRQMHFSHFGGSAFSDGEEDVECLTLASFIKNNRVEHVDILKIDVENAEYEIFGASDFKDVAGQIDYIIGEVHGGQQPIADNLEKFGFKVKHLKGSLFEARR